MPIEAKDHAFVKLLFESTQAGKVKWEPTAEPDQFTTSFGGKYKVFVDKFPAVGGKAAFYALKLADESEQELLNISSNQNASVEALFHLALRRSLNVDAALDEIMGSLG